MSASAAGAIYLATENAGKLAELADLLELGERLRRPPAGFAFPPEDGQTYAENALAKARALARVVGAPAIGDDSGLEVEALGGRPGLHSARYAATDAARIARLLDELRSVPSERRGARFVCALAIVFPGGREEVGTGQCAGTIAEVPRGGGGFGYDPIFVSVDLCGHTFAEASAAEKALFGHRGRAARALKSLLPPGLVMPD